MFGLKYFAEIRSMYKEVFWRVEIAERGYNGSSEEINIENKESALQITWEKQGDEFFVPIKGSEATIEIHCLENFKFLNLFTSDPRKFRVSIYRNTKLYWRGYIVADLYSENFEKPPYSVIVKAVDGFNLLSGIPYNVTDGASRKSLWEIIKECYDALELDISISDWLDLYAPAMDETKSPFTQAYIDVDRIFNAYPDATLLDVLELCLKPFAAQIFQANGSLHIRRAVSLYNDVRPYTFYEIGSQFGRGWLVTHAGDKIISADGEVISTRAARDRIDSMWDDSINIDDSSTLEIEPALRSLKVDITEAKYENLDNLIGLYNKGEYSSNVALSVIQAKKELYLHIRNDATIICEHDGFKVQKSITPLLIEFNATLIRHHATPSLVPRDPITFKYGVKFQNANSTVYLNGDGSMTGDYTELTESCELFSPRKISMKIPEIPDDYTVKLFFVNPNGHLTNDLRLGDFKIGFEVDKAEDSDFFSQTTIINSDNNLEMEIDIPLSHIPPLDNATLKYPLFFTDFNGVVIDFWYAISQNVLMTLREHIISTAIKYKAFPTKRICGPMFTGKHIDLNTVVADDKYLKTGFYVNSMALSCLCDTCDAELIEMPKLINVPLPQGEDCELIFSSRQTIKSAVKCGSGVLYMVEENNNVYFVDLYRKLSMRVLESSLAVTINSSLDSAFIITSDELIEVGSSGRILRKTSRPTSKPIKSALNIDGKLCIVFQHRNLKDNEYTLCEYTQLGPQYQSDDGLTSDWIYLELNPRNVYSSRYITIVNGVDQAKSRTVLLDTRRGSALATQWVRSKMWSDILAINEYYFAENKDSKFNICKFNNVSFDESEVIYTSANAHPKFSDISNSWVLYSDIDAAYVFNLATKETKLINSLSKSNIVNVLIIANMPYVVREDGIYQYARY